MDWIEPLAGIAISISQLSNIAHAIGMRTRQQESELLPRRRGDAELLRQCDNLPPGLIVQRDALALAPLLL
jgi:hypothetical protein